MNADVEKAVERLDRSGIRGVVAGQPAFDDWETVRQALRDQEAEIARLMQVAHLIPTSWLDSLLTGPEAVIDDPPYDCKDIERLLNAIRARITAHLGAKHD